MILTASMAPLSSPAPAFRHHSCACRELTRLTAFAHGAQEQIRINQERMQQLQLPGLCDELEGMSRSEAKPRGISTKKVKATSEEGPARTSLRTRGFAPELAQGIHSESRGRAVILADPGSSIHSTSTKPAMGSAAAAAMEAAKLEAAKPPEPQSRALLTGTLHFPSADLKYICMVQQPQRTRLTTGERTESVLWLGPNP